MPRVPLVVLALFGLTFARSSAASIHLIAEHGDNLAGGVSRAATTVGEFGDPVNTDECAICVYDGSGLVAEATAPHGGTCAGKPCWTGNASGFKYKDKDLTPAGVLQVLLKAGLDTEAKIIVKTKGSAFPMPSLASLTSPLQVQLRKSSGGPCWGAVYRFPPAQKNDATTFKDKAD